MAINTSEFKFIPHMPDLPPKHLKRIKIIIAVVYFVPVAINLVLLVRERPGQQVCLYQHGGDGLLFCYSFVQDYNLKRLYSVQKYIGPFVSTKFDYQIKCYEDLNLTTSFKLVDPNTLVGSKVRRSQPQMIHAYDYGTSTYNFVAKRERYVCQLSIAYLFKGLPYYELLDLIILVLLYLPMVFHVFVDYVTSNDLLVVHTAFSLILFGLLPTALIYLLVCVIIRLYHRFAFSRTYSTVLTTLGKE